MHTTDENYSFAEHHGSCQAFNNPVCEASHTQIRVEDTMEIILDRPRCEGHGLCEEVAPQLMHLDDEGELVLDVVHVNEDQLDAAKQAARVCPVAALRLA